jgi:bifunctional DNase/RNase
VAFFLEGRPGLAQDGKTDDKALVEMKVKGVTVQPMSNIPVMLLIDKGEKKALPILIGAFEARAIAFEMEHISTPRPMTHDLIKNILNGIKAKVKKVVINDLKGGTFYATISLFLNNAEIKLDSRPSDAIALALRVKSPIFVTQKVMKDAAIINLDEKKLREGEKDWEKWLEETPSAPEEKIDL